MHHTHRYYKYKCFVAVIDTGISRVHIYLFFFCLQTKINVEIINNNKYLKHPHDAEPKVLGMESDLIQLVLLGQSQYKSPWENRLCSNSGLISVFFSFRENLTGQGRAQVQLRPLDFRFYSKDYVSAFREPVKMCLLWIGTVKHQLVGHIRRMKAHNIASWQNKF